MHRSLWYTGLLLITAGVTLTALPTGAFDTAAGERGVGVNIAADDAGLIALEASGQTVADSSPGQANTGSSHPTVVVGGIINNLDRPMDVTYQASINTEVVDLRDNGGQFVLDPGEQFQLEARCLPAEEGTGTATLTVSIEEASTGKTTITDTTLTQPIQFDCEGPPKGGSGNPGGGQGGGGGNQGGGGNGQGGP